MLPHGALGANGVPVYKPPLRDGSGGGTCFCLFIFMYLYHKKNILKIFIRCLL